MQFVISKWLFVLWAES